LDDSNIAVAIATMEAATTSIGTMVQLAMHGMFERSHTTKAPRVSTFTISKCKRHYKKSEPNRRPLRTNFWPPAVIVQ